MNNARIWEDLKSTVIEEMEEMIDPNTGKADDVIVCLNIHTKTESGYQKIPTHKLDQATTSNVW